ncbi:TonB-dependent receptor [Hallella colorans]|uniref:TonB-dependent receptor n=1 Tax=Hallella colorans TaxID=1703337 RepID=UPI0023F1BE49|nr:carboxypeptidase regulatory-like domain-containing protein [Hallella colorans]
MQKRLLFLVAMVLMFTTSAIAQITTSGINGKVTAGNEDVIGATVEAVHTPSGTRYMAVTNTKGMFTINGMRVGGPYEVKISYIGYQTKEVKDITLQLAQTYRLNVSLTEDAQQLGEVVISAKGTKFTTEKTGASTNISNTMMQNMPTVSRSITDFTRLSPYGGNGMSFGGTDGRTANFTVDGADFNNNFGLSSALPGGGNPISIDAIEEMQVVVSPFDVRQTNFIGGGVNAITKSGTNTFKGTAYIYHRNEQMRGDAINNTQILGAREKDRSTTYGFTLGGPIMKDKLFFFVNGEMVKTPKVANRWRASENGEMDADNYQSRTTVKDLETVSKFVKDKYGYDTGSYNSFPGEESNYKILARLDWNINTMNHLALRYNYTKNRQWSAPNASSMDGGSRSPYARLSQYSMSFANAMYARDGIVNTVSLDLNSRINNSLSNQFLATYSKLDDVRYSDSSEFPFVDILDGKGVNYMALGYELFTWNNAVHNNVWNAKDDITYYTGNHKIMAGLSYEHQMADNQYMRSGTGYYRYKTLDDFLNGAAPEIVNLTYGYNGESSPAARVIYNKLGVYVQDEWQATDKFKLTYGLRMDGMFYDNSNLMTNNAIKKLDYFGQHIDTGKWPNNSLTLSPRVGFTYDVLGNERLKVRGGTGLFSGRLPLVFFTNMPTNSGMVQYQAQINAAEAQKKGFSMDTFAGGLVTDANGKPTIAALQGKLKELGYPMTIDPTKGTVPSSLCGVDPKFKMPQIWKTSLAVDYAIPVSFPLNVTVEGIVNKNIYSAVLRDWSVPYVGGFARFNGVDNRPIYPTGFTVNRPAYMLENTQKGYGWIFNLSVNARPFDGMELMMAYTHTASKELTSLPGSNASSVLNYMSTVTGPNFVRLHNAQDVTPDRLIASLNLHDKSGNHYSFIYEGRRGTYNYSFMTVNDMNGDGYNFDAIYIPTDQQVADNQFRFVSEDDKTRFMDYVHNNSYLKNHQGEYAEAYSLYSPWVHRIDLSYKHDFKVNVGQTKHLLQLSFDMKNMLNFFNSSWGVAKIFNPEIAGDPRILKYEGVDADGYATFSTPTAINKNAKTWAPNHNLGQCWYASVGIKYMFN